jgi:hypothetical protein
MGCQYTLETPCHRLPIHVRSTEPRAIGCHSTHEIPRPVPSAAKCSIHETRTSAAIQLRKHQGPSGATYRAPRMEMVGARPWWCLINLHLRLKLLCIKDGSSASTVSVGYVYLLINSFGGAFGPRGPWASPRGAAGGDRATPNKPF